MDPRELRAMQIAATTRLRKTTDHWIVPSQTGTGSYKVTPRRVETFRADQHGRFTCTCPDYELRCQPCKHTMAVELTIRREVSETGQETVTKELRVTYTQDWAAYNRGQCEEGERFTPMLADLCSTIRQPHQGRGRPRLPMSDMAFEMVSKVYTGLSARRHDSDVREHCSKGLTAQDPHFNSVLRYMRDPEMTPVLTRLVELSALPLKGVETDFAVDSTGFTTSRFVRWYDHKWGKERSRQEWVKLHAMTGVRTNIVTAVEVTDWRNNDTKYLPPLLTTTADNFTIGDVSGDKAYISKSNLNAIEKFGGSPFIPFKADQGAYLIDAPAPAPEASAWDRLFHMFAYHREDFLLRYHQRSNVEATFSVIKRKFGDSLRSKSEVGQYNEVLCKVIAHNLCCVISAVYELDLEVPGFSNALAS